MIGPRFVLQLAWRESRAARRRLWLLTGSVTAGVAALVAINSFTQNLAVSVAEQSQALLGADLSISSRQPFSPRVSALLDTLVRGDSTARRPGRVARVVNFAAMAYVPRTAGARLVQARAVEPGYPFYGEITTDPPSQWRRLSEGGKALVDPAVLAALGAHWGDTLALGEARFRIAGTVLNVPGDVGVASAFGPRVFIAARDLPATALLRFGSLAEYEAFVKLPVAADAQKIANQYRPSLRNERYWIRTVQDDREDLTDTLSRLGHYLGLVALTALLLGGLGVASATHVFIRRKLETIAILRCLGATSAEVFAIYLLQAVAMGLAGSLTGAAIGIGLQQLMPAVFAGLLPVDVRVTLAPRAILTGIGLGLWVSAVFALLPLLSVRRVSPLVTLRRDYEPGSRRRDPLVAVALLLLGASVVGLAALQVADLRDGALFSAGVGAAVAALWLASLGLSRAVRRWFPTRWPYLARQGLANLYRPANQTVTVVLALGFGAFLLSTLFLVQHNLLREFRVGGPGERPNLMFFDIQTDQREGVAQVLREHGYPGSPMVPIVPMRIRSLKGQPVRADTTSPPDSAARRGQGGRGGRGRNQPAPPGPAGWAVRREYRSTYRDTMTSSERLVAGNWWGKDGQTDGRADRPTLISVEADLARELGVTVGDEIVWDVQGIPVVSRVANLREVEWARFQTNFFVVFQSGALEGAPQMHVTLTRVDSAAARGRVQRRVAERYPNVAAIDLAQIQQAIEAILSKAALAVRFLAFFSLAAGAVVLVGAVTGARLQRLREGVLLKTLGATRGQVLRILLVEYAALGLLAAFGAITLSSMAGWALAKWFFKARFDLPALSLTGLALALVTLTIAVGLWNSAEVLKQPPLEALRAE